jgi:hypothetical protein
MSPLAILRIALEKTSPKVVEKLGFPKEDRGVKDYSYQNPDHPQPHKPYRPRVLYHGLNSPHSLPKPGKPHLTARVIFSGAMSTKNMPDFSEKELQAIQRWGYAPLDIVIWARIISEHELDKALGILKWAISERATQERPAVPLFVILMLLRRCDFTAHSLQRILCYTWAILRQGKRPDTFRDRQIFMVFTRLHRLARHIWPQALVNISAILTTFLPWGQKVCGLRWTGPAYERLTAMYNRALVLLSQASTVRPFLSNAFAEKAQFMLLAEMTRFPEVLKINSNGFKGLVKVQLASKKTRQEREWASLQSRAWPPLPEPRNQLDVGKGFEFGASRAVKTLQHMRMAGYSSPSWEKVAQIYAGWETDGSPTIQTRKVIKPIAEITQKPEMALWSARIDVSRDIREAWARYIEFENTKRKPNHWVFYAIFKKLARERHRQIYGQSGVVPQSDVLPGDSLDLLEPATSPMQRVYLSREPDSYMDLFQKMMEENPRLSSHFIGFLIANAPTVEDGIEIWQQTSKATAKTDLIVSACNSEGSATPMDDTVFAGLVKLMCRSPWSRGMMNYGVEITHYNSLRRLGYQLTTTGKGLDALTRFPHRLSLVQALWLVRERRCHDHRVFWYLIQGVLTAIRGPDVRPFAFQFDQTVCLILDTMSELSVPINGPFFHKLCKYAELARDSAVHQARESTSTGPIGSNGDIPLALKNPINSHILRNMLLHMTTPTPDLQNPALELPNSALPHIPTSLALLTPLDCLNYVRALAAYADHEGIYSFVKWLVSYEPEMRNIIEQQIGGSKRWSYTMAAIRLALEDPERLFARSLSGMQAAKAPEDLVELVKETLKGLKTLPGWPSDRDLTKDAGE